MRPFLLLVFLFLIDSCGSSKVGFGEPCKTQDDCNGGLSCVTLEKGSTDNCVAGASVCTENCTTDTTCTKYGAGITCEMQCPLFSRGACTTR